MIYKIDLWKILDFYFQIKILVIASQIYSLVSKEDIYEFLDPELLFYCISGSFPWGGILSNASSPSSPSWHEQVTRIRLAFSLFCRNFHFWGTLVDNCVYPVYTPSTHIYRAMELDFLFLGWKESDSICMNNVLVTLFPRKKKQQLWKIIASCEK